MAITIAFDIYGTLVDTAGVTERLRPVVGDRAPDFAQRWREKQLEYTFRRALMGTYLDFAVCVEQSLDYTAGAFGIALNPTAKGELLQLYRQLPAFPDSAPALEALRGKGLRIFAFSNGRADDVEDLLRHAGLRERFHGVVSLMDISTYKPDPEAYRYFRHRSGAGDEEVWLVSGNPFDVIGAVAAGMKAIWVRRSAHSQFDPWEFRPTAIVSDLREIAGLFRDGSATMPAG
jgi:2-haloacid dehalogenase